MNEIMRMAIMLEQETDADKRAAMRGVLRELERELLPFEPTQEELDDLRLPASPE